MLRTVRVAGRLVELAGLQQVWMGVDHLSNSRITLYYPNGPTKTIDYAYGQWAEAKKDENLLKDALKEFQRVETPGYSLSNSSPSTCVRA
jgi:hypothetical protein